jgi:hypothetical protein
MSAIIGIPCFFVCEKKRHDHNTRTTERSCAKREMEAGMAVSLFEQETE